MSRSMTAGALTALTAEHAVYGYAVEMDFTSGFVRVNSTPMTLTIDGNSFTGLGDLGDISPLSEGLDLQARGVRLGLSGVPSSMRAIALGEHYQGRSAKIWSCLFDSDHKLIADPIGPWRYKMDTMEIVGQGEDDDFSKIILSCADEIAGWRTAKTSRYTDGEQQARHPGDKGLEFVPSMQDFVFIWGRA